MRRALALAVLAAALAVVGAPCAAQGASTDSEAPPDAPPHWLPPEPWVYNHWLPYDEGRLERLVGATRGELWQQLRDDRRNLAQLAARHGRSDPARLAAELVAPWRGHASAAQLSVLRSRAERTLTQGHLAQHLLFHSLHQFAIPSAAPELFGVSDAAFRALRRSELSPLAIGALHGRTPAAVHAGAIAVLAERARAGVRGGETPAGQARLLLARQLRQLPRWLGQARYNGPPLTSRGQLVAAPRNYARNPAFAADGRHVVFETYRQGLDAAVTLGEIAVVARDLGSGAARTASALAGPAADGLADPTSAYNASASADGRRVAYEASEGNRNFAKRYGQITVRVSDAATGTTTRVEAPGSAREPSRSAYNPVLAADGRHLAFQAVVAGATRVLVRDLRTGATTDVSTGGPRRPRGGYRDVLAPSLSADGRRVAFTVLSGRLSGRRHARAAVVVHDRARGTDLVLPGASDPALSGDGRRLAHMRDGLRVRDLPSGRTTRIAVPPGATVLDPRLSADGAVVAFTAVRGATRQVLAHDRRTGRTTLVSRADGPRGAPARGTSGDAALSADGRRVAFVSDAANLSAAKSDATPAVFVRDLRARTTRLVSAPSWGLDARAVMPPLVPGDAGAAEGPSRAGATRVVEVSDNTFLGAGPRPVVRVRAGTVVTWRWRSRQSHNVTATAGPERFASSTAAHGTFRHRFRTPGTQLVTCSLHAPGMRMRVEVR